MVATERGRPLHPTRIRRRFKLVLQREDRRSEASVVAPNTTYHEGVRVNFGEGGGKPCFVILDDLLNEVYSKQVCDLFTRGSYHKYISVILIKENLFHLGRFFRVISP